MKYALSFWEKLFGVTNVKFTSCQDLFNKTLGNPNRVGWSVYCQIQYKTDHANFGVNESYAKGDDVIKRGSDDCDGFRNVYYDTLRLSGDVEPKRLRVEFHVGGAHAICAVIDRKTGKYIGYCDNYKSGWHPTKPANCEAYIVKRCEELTGKKTKDCYEVTWNGKKVS